VSALEALCDYALYKSTFTLHYIVRMLFYSFLVEFWPMFLLSVVHVHGVMQSTLYFLFVESMLVVVVVVVVVGCICL